MSAAATRWAWQQALKPTAKLVLLALADRANAVGECWPSTAKLVRDTGLYRETIHAAIHQMEASKIIQVSRANGRGNIYKLLIQPDQNQSEKADQSSFADQSEKADSTGLLLPPTRSAKAAYHQSAFADTNLKEEPNNNLSKNLKDNRDTSSPQKIEDESQADQVTDVFFFWQQTMNHPKAVLDSKRKSVITKALKNYSADQLKAAITGCAKSAFHMGQNDQQKIYDSLDLIFRSADKIEGFIQNSTITPPPAGVTTYASKHQKSSALSGQIFGAAAQVLTAQRASAGGNRHPVLQDDGYLLPTVD